jgi:hypothetical protein
VNSALILILFRERDLVAPASRRQFCAVMVMQKSPAGRWRHQIQQFTAKCGTTNPTTRMVVRNAGKFRKSCTARGKTSARGAMSLDCFFLANGNRGDCFCVFRDIVAAPNYV